MKAVEPVPELPRVAVVEHDPALAEQLASRLEAVPYASIGALEANVGSDELVVVVLGPSIASEDALDEVERVTRDRPHIRPVLLGPTLSAELLQRAMRAGVRDVVTTQEELPEAILRVGERLQAAFPPASAAPQPSARGRMITVFSSKGGTGKSVVACNVATLLARRTDRPVALVDADLQFGDVAVMLHLIPQRTVVDAVTAIDRLDATLLRSLLIRHEPSGVFVLPAPLEPAFADQVTSGNLARIVETLRTFCDYVVVDTPAQFNDVVLGLLDESDEVLIVAAMDIPSVKNVKLGLQTLKLLNLPMTKIKLVINRANSKVNLDLGDIEQTLGMKAACLIPSDVAVPRSVNNGTPVVLESPKSGVTRSLEHFADELVAVAHESPSRKAV